MYGQSRLFGAALVTLTLLALTACSKATTSDPTPAASGGGGSSQTTAAPAKAALPTNGKCVLITNEKAASLVGSSVTASSSNVTNAGGIIRVDGCTYIGSANNLGYDINDHSSGGITASALVAQAKTVMAAQPSVTPFDVTGGDSSVAFTASVGPKVMARIEAAKGQYTIAVNSTSVDAETAKKISTGALAVLIAAMP